MAYAFTSAPLANITGTYTSHLGLSKFTMAAWMRRGASGSHQGCGFTGSDNNRRTHMTHFTDNNMYFVLCDGASANGRTAQNITGWNHWAMAFDGTQSTNASRLAGYVNGSSVSLTFSGTIPSALSSNSANQTLQIGYNQNNNIYTVGDIAEFATWEDCLSASDIASLGKGFSPLLVRPDKLLSSIPLMRGLIDAVTGTTLTNVSGNATVAAHPRVYA
jgi:hypothetical protein